MSGVILNVTAVEPTDAGYLTLYPAGASVPDVSNVNFTPGDVVANHAVVAVDTDGSLRVFNRNGRVDVILDVFGYLRRAPAN